MPKKTAPSSSNKLHTVPPYPIPNVIAYPLLIIVFHLLYLILPLGLILAPIHAGWNVLHGTATPNSYWTITIASVYLSTWVLFKVRSRLHLQSDLLLIHWCKWWYKLAEQLPLSFMLCPSCYVLHVIRVLRHVPSTASSPPLFTRTLCAPLCSRRRPIAHTCLWLPQHHTKRGCPNDLLNTNPLLHFVLSSIPVSILTTAPPPVSPSTNLIYACHPHGTIAFNRAAVGFQMSHLWSPATGIKNLRVLTATAAFYVPVIRELWIWSYCIEASKSVAVKALKRLNPKRTVEDRVAIFVYPGGEKEQLLTVQGKEVVYLKDRKGFVKLALEQGCELVPVYAFGESDLYYHSPFLLEGRQWIAKTFGAAIPLICGSVGLLPYFPKSGVTMVFGDGVGLKPAKDPENVTKEELDSGHELYMTKLKELFDKEKGALGYGDRELEIV